LSQRNAFDWIEVGRWIPATPNNLFTRNQYIRVGEIPEFVRKHNNFGLFTTTYQYDVPDLTKALLYGDFYLDFDCKDDFEKVRTDAIRSLAFLNAIMGIPADKLDIFFSGSKGIHVIVPAELLGVQPDPKLNLIFRYLASEMSKHMPNKTLDLVIYDNKRLFRIPGSIHDKTGLHKISLTLQELYDLSADEIRTLAKTPRLLPSAPRIGVRAVVGQYQNYVKKYHEAAAKPVDIKGRTKGVLKYMPPCVESLIKNGAVEGSRNNSIAALASFYKSQGKSYTEANDLVKEWNNTVNSPPTKDHELERTVRSIFSGSAQYGCSTMKLLAECDEKNCKLMKNRSTGVTVHDRTVSRRH